MVKLGDACYLLLLIYAVIRGAEIRCQPCPVVQYDEEAVTYKLVCEWYEKRIRFQCRDGYSYQSGSYESECWAEFSSILREWRWGWTGMSIKCISTKTSITTTTTATIVDVNIPTGSPTMTATTITDARIPTGSPTTMDLSVPQTTTLSITDARIPTGSPTTMDLPVPQTTTITITDARIPTGSPTTMDLPVPQTTTISITNVTIPTGSPTTMDLSVPQTVQYPSSTVKSSTNDLKTTSARSCNGEILLSKMYTLNAVPLLKSFDPNTTFKTDDRVLYECANGYRFINGTLEHVCGNDGSWKGALPYCKRCRCPCSRMKNQVIIKTQEELQNKINVMTGQLKVKMSDLTSVKSRKTSAPDPRPSSKAVGSLLGIGILVFIFAVIIISDFPLLYRHIRYGL